ncbi:MAG: LPS export ABC transporter periplasmic protein LptC [Prevotella sp.]
MKVLIQIVFLFISCLLAASCQEAVEHTAGAIRDRDSVAVMTSLGVNTLISDSGIIKYRIVTERWEVNQNKKPSRWTFDKGLFLEQFDEKFHVQSYIQCDTAYYYDQKRLWELRSRVRILTKDGLRFSSERLYWDEGKHELYSNTFSRLVTPERTLQGSYFRSDEHMTHYLVTNSRGSFESTDFGGGPNAGSTPGEMPDSMQMQQRSRALPSRNQ